MARRKQTKYEYLDYDLDNLLSPEEDTSAAPVPEAPAPSESSARSTWDVTWDTIKRVPGSAWDTVKKAWANDDVRAEDVESIRREEEEKSKFVQDAYKDAGELGKTIAESGESIGYSGTTMLAAMGAGAAAGSALPGLGTVAGAAIGGLAAMGASGKVAYNASQNDFLRTALLRADDAFMEQEGRHITEEEWQNLKYDLGRYAQEYAYAEAWPEAIGSTFLGRALASGSKAAKALFAGKGLGKAAMRYAVDVALGIAEELPTEALTEREQSRVMSETGLSDEGEKTYWQSMKDVAGPTALTTGILVTGGRGLSGASDYVHHSKLDRLREQGAVLFKDDKGHDYTITPDGYIMPLSKEDVEYWNRKGSSTTEQASKPEEQAQSQQPAAQEQSAAEATATEQQQPQQETQPEKPTTEDPYSDTWDERAKAESPQNPQPDDSTEGPRNIFDFGEQEKPTQPGTRRDEVTGEVDLMKPEPMLPATQEQQYGQAWDDARQQEQSAAQGEPVTPEVLSPEEDVRLDNAKNVTPEQSGIGQSTQPQQEEGVANQNDIFDEWMEVLVNGQGLLKQDEQGNYSIEVTHKGLRDVGDYPISPEMAKRINDAFRIIMHSMAARDVTPTEQPTESTEQQSPLAIGLNNQLPAPQQETVETSPVIPEQQPQAAAESVRNPEALPQPEQTAHVAEQPVQEEAPIQQETAQEAPETTEKPEEKKPDTKTEETEKTPQGESETPQTENKQEEEKEEEKPVETEKEEEYNYFKDHPVKASVKEQRHSKTGEQLYVAKLGERVDDDTYKALKEQAKKTGDGYWSRFAGGFVFKDRESADEFVRTISGKEPTNEQTEPVEQRTVSESPDERKGDQESKPSDERTGRSTDEGSEQGGGERGGTAEPAGQLGEKADERGDADRRGDESGRNGGEPETVRSPQSPVGGNEVSDETETGGGQRSGELGSSNSGTNTERERLDVTSVAEEKALEGSELPLSEEAKKATPKPTNTETQSQYVPKSGNKNILGTLVPTNQRDAVQNALDKVAEKHGGDVDAYVAKELGYKNKEELHQYFAAEQVDVLALALDNIAEGKGFVLGDQTGIGKGRVCAAIIRWARKNGKTPVFVSMQSTLFPDMMRDVADIGAKDLVHPYQTNNDSGLLLPVDYWQDISDEEAKKLDPSEWEEFTDDNGKKTKKKKVYLAALSDTNKKKALKDIIENGKLPDGYDSVFTTYSQLSMTKDKNGNFKPNPRCDALEAIQKDVVFILDEAHNAAGTESSVGEFIRDFTSEMPGGVLYSSATFAKRPESMSLYNKTGLSELGSPEELEEIASKGGLAMQQAISATLTQNGQYIRREKSYAGATMETVVVSVSEQTSDAVSTASSYIKDFSDVMQSEAVVDKVNSLVRSYLESKGIVIEEDPKKKKKKVFRPIAFGSLLPHVVAQSTLSLKVTAVADSVEESVKRGEKPVITLSYTMGSYVDELVAGGIEVGEKIDKTFGDLLLNNLDKCRTVNITDSNGKTIARYTIPLEELPFHVQKLYAEAEAKTQAQEFADMPISPIDALKAELARRKISSDEITGRSTILEYREENGEMGCYYKGTRDSGAASKTEAARKFNNGDVDVLIINRSGSTGISLHASSKFKDQRPRTMMILQPDLNIDVFMQTLGRVFRTGQVEYPKFQFIISDMPAEKRAAAILNKKMASLNANTTANAKGQKGFDDTPDFMNAVGDQAAYDVLSEDEDLDLQKKFGIRIPKDPKPSDIDGLMNKVTGKIPLLSRHDQEQVYDRLITAYNNLLTTEGSGVLDDKPKPFDAKIERYGVLTRQGDATNKFAEASYVCEVSVKVTGKPYSYDDVREHALKNREKDISNADLYDEVDKYVQSYASKPETKVDISSLRKKVTAQLREVNKIRSSFPIGTLVKTSNAVDGHYGVVVGYTRSSKAGANPVAPSSWKVVIDVADEKRSITVPLSKIVMNVDGKVPEGKTSLSSAGISRSEMEEKFKNGQRVRRQNRVIVMGNVMAGFGEVLDSQDGRGEIVTFEMNDGSVQMGVMIPKDITADQVLKSAEVKFNDAWIATKFITSRPVSGRINSENGQLAIAMSNTKGKKDFSVHIPLPSNRKTDFISYERLVEMRQYLANDFRFGSKDMYAKIEEEMVERFLLKAYEWGQTFSTDNDTEDARKLTGEASPWIKSKDGKAEFSVPGSDVLASVSTSTVKGGSGNGMSVADIRGYVDEWGKVAHGAAPVVVVQNFEDLPAQYQKSFKEKGADPKSVEAFYSASDGTVYMIASNLTEDRLAPVWMHEQMGHGGFRALLGEKGRKQLLNRLFVMLGGKGNPQIAELAREYNLDLGTEEGRHTVVEELLAHEAEKEDLSPDERKWWQKAWQHIAETLQKAWAKLTGNNAKLGELQVKTLLRDMKTQLREGGQLGQRIGGSVLPSFIGEKGASALDRAEEASTRMDDLLVARRMEEEGKDERAIKLATGWERGSDGMWRYEVPENMFNLQSIIARLSVEREKPLRDLRNKERKLSDKVYYLRSVIPARLTKKYSEEKKTKYREMRKELDAAWDELYKTQKEIREAEKTLEDTPYKTTLSAFLKENSEVANAYPEILELPVVFESLGYKEGYYDGEKIVLNKNRSEKQARSTLIHEVQHAIQAREGFARGGNIEEAGGFDRYQRLSGEVEARNASRRMEMTTEERRASLAKETEDVAREDQIILDDVSTEDRAFIEDNIQEETSEDTSIPQVAAVLKKIPWKEGMRNIDIGGGKYDLGTEYLEERGAENLIFDPFNRDEKHNQKALDILRGGEEFDTATVANVLNVIRRPRFREMVIRQAARAIKQDGTAYFSIYERNGDGVGQITKDHDGKISWQNNMKTEAYMPEVEKYFGKVVRHGNIIEASQPKVEGPVEWVPNGKTGDTVLASIGNDIWKKVRRDPKKFFMDLKQDYGKLSKEAKEDISIIQEARILPAVLARKFPIVGKLLDIQRNRDDKRNRAFNKAMEGMDEFAKMRTKDKVAYSYVQDIIFSLDNNSSVPMKEQKFLVDPQTQNITGLNDKFYTELRKLLYSSLKKGAIKDMQAYDRAVDLYIKMRKSLDRDQIAIFERAATLVPKSKIDKLRNHLGTIPYYFPHMRFGDYYIRVIDKKTGDTVYRTHVDAHNKVTASAALSTLREKLAKSYDPALFDIEQGEIKNLPEDVFDKSLSTVDMEAVLMRALDDIKKNGKITGKEQVHLRSAMLHQIADVMKAHGFSQHMMKRRDIAGFETDDIFKSLMAYKSGLYGWLTKMDASKEFGDTLVDYVHNNDIRRSPRLYGYLKNYVKDMLRNSDKIDRATARLKTYFFIKFLGGNLKTATINLTQNIVLGMPILSREIGIGNAHAMFMKDAMRTINDRITGIAKKGQHSSSLTKEEQDFLDSFFLSNAGQAQLFQEWQDHARGMFGKKAQAFINLMGLPMREVERFNRLSLALSAYRAAKAGKVKFAKTLKKYNETKGVGWSEENARNFARDVVDETHFVYGRGNMPQMLRHSDAGRWLSTAYTFRTFSYNLASWLYRNLVSGENGKAGRLAVLQFAAAQMLIGGLTAVPLYNTFVAAVRGLSDGDDPDEWMKKQIGEGDLLDVVMYGLPSQLGVYIGGSLSLELPIATRLKNDTPWLGQTINLLTEQVLGVPYSTAVQVGKAAEYLKTNQWGRAIEEVAPSAVTNVLKANRLAKEGKRTKSGRQIGENDTRLTTSEKYAQMAGYQPVRYTKEYRENDSKQAKMGKKKEFQSNLVTEWVLAHRNLEGDALAKERKRLIGKLQEWNRNYPAEDMRITIEKVQQLAKQRDRPLK